MRTWVGVALLLALAAASAALAVGGNVDAASVAAGFALYVLADVVQDAERRP